MPSTLQRYAPTLFVHLLILSLAGLLLSMPPPGQPSPLPTAFLLKQGIVFGLLVALFYANLRLAVPRLLYGRHAPLYLALLAGAVVAVLAVHQQLENGLRVPQLLAQAREDALNVNPWCAPRPHMQLGPADEPQFLNLSILLITVLVLGMGTTLAAVQKGQRDAESRQVLEQARLATELSLLKAQINPHFFFNTLNNIYSLTLIDGNQARAALHRLSRMMRYVLYETPADTTLLSQEVTFVRDYIELMHLRLTDEVQVTFQVPEPLLNAPIAPMLLLPYVENAFKHGVGASGPSHIFVALRQPDERTLALEVRNTLFPKQATLAEGGGIGLVNTLRRLELLYPGRYSLVVHERTPDNEYQVLLTLTLL
ncbi:sensor histidine kinase [Hymenobacter aquaticus]|uniref:Sensor histidine kinase n=1 Tax=Hymenobacter aquaticus TaxID=1867101 RepID=A0A4Z0Q4I6_9BACT|nr:histidine kinase [Hymenobacter aquaticus]TGE24978.1 sensor histidine kinase [Hymenobacter aquaticus]